VQCSAVQCSAVAGRGEDPKRARRRQSKEPGTRMYSHQVFACLVGINRRVGPWVSDLRAASPPAAECPSRPARIQSGSSTRPPSTRTHRHSLLLAAAPRCCPFASGAVDRSPALMTRMAPMSSHAEVGDGRLPGQGPGAWRRYQYCPALRPKRATDGERAAARRQ
jgi:hypothetical protein